MADETPKTTAPKVPAKRGRPRKDAAATTAPRPAAKPRAAAAKPAAKRATAAKAAPAAPRAKRTTAAAKPKSTLGGVTETARRSLKDGASQLSQGVIGHARDYAEDGKVRAGGVLDEIARLMTDAAGTVDAKVGEQYGRYARGAADAVANFSQSLRAKNVDDLVGDVRDFARKSPAIAIGTAAALGFVAVRLVKAGLESGAAKGEKA